MMVCGVACEPAVEIFESSDSERHIVEISWWPKDDAVARACGPLTVCRYVLHWDETQKIRDGLIEAMARMETRRGLRGA